MQSAKGPVQLRAATAGDLPAIVDITWKGFRQTYIDPQTGAYCHPDADLRAICGALQGKYPRLISDPEHHILVATVDEKVVGYSIIHQRAEGAFLDKLYLLSEYQGKALGNFLLLAQMEFVCRQWKTERMILLEQQPDRLSSWLPKITPEKTAVAIGLFAVVACSVYCGQSTSDQATNFMP